MAGCQAVAQILFFKYCKLAPGQELQFFLLFTFPFFTEEFHLSGDRKILVVVWSWVGAGGGGAVEMPKQSFFFFFLFPLAFLLLMSGRFLMKQVESFHCP